jgi:hypothetical protein
MAVDKARHTLTRALRGGVLRRRAVGIVRAPGACSE